MLKDKSISDRDLMWSIETNKIWQWKEGNSIKRIVEWGWSLEDKSYVSDESIFLFGKFLVWLFTNSNRYIRDKATKAFSSIFIERTLLLIELIKEFKDVNDPYVLERLIAGVLGAVSHSTSLQDNTKLAQFIYDLYFKNRKPPLNILTRDYARGIIEYVVNRGGKLNFNKDNLYPPFQSNFPKNIPPESWIETIKIKKEGKYTEMERGEALIAHSVLSWDFSRYILGTNHGSSIPFAKYTIESKKSFIELRQKLRGNKKKFLDIYVGSLTMLNSTSELGKKLRQNFRGKDLESKIESAKYLKSEVKKILKENFSNNEYSLFIKAQEYIEDGFESRKYNIKKFDVQLVQRYILKRVFDLGWTKEKFGEFDAGIDSNYRSASKAERVGKKYQWIAYYEILALLSDTFVFLEGYTDATTDYKGSWQHHLRNIDPTLLIRYNPKEETFEDAFENWWLKEKYENWEENNKTWFNRFDDMPSLEKILNLKDESQAEFYLLYDRIVWSSKKPVGEDRHEAGRKDIWIDVQAFLVSKNDKKELLKDGSSELYWIDEDCPAISQYYRVFNSELFESDAYGDITDNYFVKKPYKEFNTKLKKVKIIHTVEDFSFSDEYDMSQGRVSIYKPSRFLFQLINGKFGLNDACVYNKNNEVIAFDPGVYYNNSQKSFLIKKDVLDKALKDNNLEIVWFFCGEKEDIGPRIKSVYRMLYSGFAYFEGGDLKLNFIINCRNKFQPAFVPVIINAPTVRSVPSLK